MAWLAFCFMFFFQIFVSVLDLPNSFFIGRSTCLASSICHGLACDLTKPLVLDFPFKVLQDLFHSDIAMTAAISTLLKLNSFVALYTCP